MKNVTLSAACLVPVLLVGANTMLMPSTHLVTHGQGAVLEKTPAKEFFSAIRIEFQKPQYRFTLAEASAGISIPYNVIVDNDYKGISPICQDIGRASSPNEFGLIVFPCLEGDSVNADGTTTRQHYGMKDIGLGAGNPPPGTIRKGTHAQVFEWAGRNWHGPSDTGRALGQPFPPGEYTLVVSCKGETRLDGKNETLSFEVKNLIKIILTK